MYRAPGVNSGGPVGSSGKSANGSLGIRLSIRNSSGGVVSTGLTRFSTFLYAYVSNDIVNVDCPRGSMSCTCGLRYAAPRCAVAGCHCVADDSVVVVRPLDARVYPLRSDIVSMLRGLVFSRV